MHPPDAAFPEELFVDADLVVHPEVVGNLDEDHAVLEGLVLLVVDEGVVVVFVGVADDAVVGVNEGESARLD